MFERPFHVAAFSGTEKESIIVFNRSSGISLDELIYVNCNQSIVNNIQRKTKMALQYNNTNLY